MRALLEFAERGEVRDLVSQATEYTSVQGVVLDYDPLWVLLWRIRCQLGDNGVDFFVKSFFARFYPGPGLAEWAIPWVGALFGVEDVEFEPPDPSWRSDMWVELQLLLGRRNPVKEPFIAKLCLFPSNPGERLPRLSEYGFPVLRERRAPAQFCMPKRPHRPLLGGISIGTGPMAGDSGTLGGIVVDQHDKRWGVTCAHVVGSQTPVDQPAVSDNAATTTVGNGRHIATLQASTAQAPCNPYNPNALMNKVDAALIEITTSVSADLQILQQGALNGITPKADLNPGTIVEMAGKESGLRTLEVGGLGVTYRMRDPKNGSLYCFHNIFELRWPRWWKVLGGRPVLRGDSGAWIVNARASGAEWAGMAIAGDRLIGYAVLSENVTDWAQQEHGLKLRVS